MPPVFEHVPSRLALHGPHHRSAGRCRPANLDAGTAAVLGKGRRPRACPFGAKTAQALDRYLRLRAAERGAKGTNALWLAEKGRGPMQSGGVAQMLKRLPLVPPLCGPGAR